ncbi:MAG: NRDE family protein [Gammaproteobacteria bacterium]|nr:NRDE family protein [Gammaproteobacteria bacterium]
MCTLSLFPSREGLIITMNRDERRDRQELNTLVTKDDQERGVSMSYSVDLVSGGTWFGMNSSGLVAALLNRYQEYCPSARQSRGLIIPQLLKQCSAQAVDNAINRLDWLAFAPCDLVFVGQSQARCYCWNGSVLQMMEIALDRGWFISSSSERLDEVIQYRRDLFDAFVHAHQAAGPSAKNILNELHLLQDSDNASSSINMSRPHSHTKSISRVIIEKDRMQYDYFNEKALAEFDPKQPWRAGVQQIFYPQALTGIAL